MTQSRRPASAKGPVHGRLEKHQVGKAHGAYNVRLTADAGSAGLPAVSCEIRELVRTGEQVREGTKNCRHDEQNKGH